MEVRAVPMTREIHRQIRDYVRIRTQTTLEHTQFNQPFSSAMRMASSLFFASSLAMISDI